jgi:uncharacterized protein YjeT (DUF2065 family)
MMRVIVAWIVGLGLIANGLTMLGVPDAWYGLVPGVPQTGPFNPHFVRDIGAAYLVAGATLVWFAIDGAARPAALAGAAFLAIHALIHLWDAAAGRQHAHQLLVDLPTVFLPPALAIWIAWPPRSLAHLKEMQNDEMASEPLDRQIRAHLEL